MTMNKVTVSVWYEDSLLEKPISVFKENAKSMERKLIQKYDTMEVYTMVEPYYDFNCLVIPPKGTIQLQQEYRESLEPLKIRKQKVA